MFCHCRRSCLCKAKYRPITNLCTISKVLEKSVSTCLWPHILSSGTFSNFQSAYRPGYFTKTAFLKVVGDTQPTTGEGFNSSWGKDTAGTNVCFNDWLKLLGVTLDTTLSFYKHASNVVWNYTFHTRMLHHIRPLFTVEAAKAAAASIIGTAFCLFNRVEPLPPTANAEYLGASSYRLHCCRVSK